MKKITITFLSLGLLIGFSVLLINKHNKKDVPLMTKLQNNAENNAISYLLNNEKWVGQRMGVTCNPVYNEPDYKLEENWKCNSNNTTSQIKIDLECSSTKRGDCVNVVKFVKEVK